MNRMTILVKLFYKYLFIFCTRLIIRVQNLIKIRRFGRDVQTPGDAVKVPFILQTRVGCNFSLDTFLESGQLWI